MNGDANEAPSWWHPDRHGDRRARLHARHRILQAVRCWFLDQGFIEVEPSALQVSPGNETHLHAFRTTYIDETLGEHDYFLHTSPEFACKKLLAAGEEKIFTLGKVYRNREAGVLHAPEFTMLEWYRSHATYDSVMADCIAIIRRAAEVGGQNRFRWRSSRCDAVAPPRTTRVADAFRARGYDLLATLDGPAPDFEALSEAARNRDPGLGRFDDWPSLFSAILVKIEADLGLDAVEFLIEYPACQSALARPAAHDPRVAERFEVFAAGVELANGFGELTCPDLQRKRLAAQMRDREEIYGPGAEYPIDEDFIAALELMPEAAGCALGFDRLVMLATGAESIQDTIWTPFEYRP